ncbi:hypothetical protein KALB_1399 [Kutzneria albida DSM 43870]|uniref:Glycosyl transferase family 1 domain-containing protein n=2 Tax=Kutzneria TaxID=43356 RepID=W5W1Q0_9PSEU|nr:hypothetical protein KALB_1399 [Kutzneria albida DSM 43870]
MGGVRVLHRHVELLVEAGVDAFVWLPTEGYRYGWFDSPAPRLYGAELALTEHDLLVVPEGGVRPGVDPAPGARKVIFNQNHFLSYLNFEPDQPYPGWQPAPGVWVVSQESAEVLAATEPELPCSLIPNPLDLDLFRPAAQRVRRIAWMPRKRPLEAKLLERALRADPRSAGVELVALQGLPETEVARILGESSVFLALGLYEGFGLPIAEALASGCLVLGYAAGGGQELFEAPGTWQLPDQRPTMLADAALSMVVDGLPDEDGVRAAARDWVAQRYTAQTATKALRTAVDEAMAQPGAACTAVHPMNLSDPELGAGIMRNFLRAFGMPELPVGPR